MGRMKILRINLIIFKFFPKISFNIGTFKVFYRRSCHNNNILALWQNVTTVISGGADNSSDSVTQRGAAYLFGYGNTEPCHTVSAVKHVNAHNRGVKALALIIRSAERDVFFYAFNLHTIPAIKQKGALVL